MGDDTGRGLLAAILAKPDDDVARLVYADWLEEQARAVECWCNGKWDADKIADFAECRTCHGTGRVPNGNAERAEFIRLQVELAALLKVPHSYHLKMCRRNALVKNYNTRCPRCRHLLQLDALRRRESDLFQFKIERLLPESLDARLTLEPAMLRQGSGPTALVRRGFVESLRLPLAAFLEHAPAVFAGQPVLSVTLSDREPLDVGVQWHWYGHTGQAEAPAIAFNRHWLPMPIVELLASGEETGATYGRRYPARDAALQALGRAATSYGRAAAAGWTHRGGKCPECNGGKGVGWFSGIDYGPCPACKGTGTRTLPGLPPLGEMSHGAH